MPYESKAQQGFMHVHHPKVAKEWDKEDKGNKNLPEHVKHAAHKPLRSDVGPEEFDKRVETRMKMAEGYTADKYGGEGETATKPKGLVSGTGDANNPDLHDQRRLGEKYKGREIGAGQDPRTGGFAPKIDGKIYDYGCDHSQEAIAVAKKIVDGTLKVKPLS